MVDYSPLDDAIVEAIRTLPYTTFNPIFMAVRDKAHVVVEELKKPPSILKQGRESTEVWRLIDRRLQALKHDGKIEFLTTKKLKAAGIKGPSGWKIVRES